MYRMNRRQISCIIPGCINSLFGLLCRKRFVLTILTNMKDFNAIWAAVTLISKYIISSLALIAQMSQKL